MKLIIEYGKGKNLITVNGVESISQLPFGLLITFTDNDTYTLDTQKLYFKLHDDHPEENKIIEFFDQESKKLGISKIELLKICISCYAIARRLK